MHACIFYIYMDLGIMYIDFKLARIYSAIVNNSYQDLLRLNANFLSLLKHTI